MHNCYPARRDEHTNDSGENSDRKCMFMIEKRLKREKQKNSTARHAAVYFMQRRRCSGSTQTDLNVSYDFARDFNYRHVPSDRLCDVDDTTRPPARLFVLVRENAMSAPVDNEISR